MAYIKAAEIIERIREIVNDGAGSVRAISASRFKGGMHEGLDDAHLSHLGKMAQKPAEVAIVAVRPHDQKIVVGGSVQLHYVDIEIRVVRALTFKGRVNDDTRDAIRALSAQDASALEQALEWPPNLETTTGGQSTDLLACMFAGSRNPVVGLEGTSMRIDTIHRFEGTALSRPAIS